MAQDYDVVIVGAGISGINFGYRLQEQHPELSYTILEGRHEIGGTWSLFKFPGIRSDSDLYTFGFPWRPWEEKTSIAKGELIIKYMRESASMYGIDKKIQFHHHVNGASFSSKEHRWTIDVTAGEKEQKTFRAKWFLICTGYYDYDKTLDAAIPGIENFKGTVAHPQFWPQDLDCTDKEVVVIGSGATAVTLIPAIAPKAKHVTMLQRSPSWMLSLPTEDPIEWAIRKLTFWNKPLQHWLLRWKWITISFLLTRFAYAYPQSARKIFAGLTDKELPPTIARDPHFNPVYNPFEQRVCVIPDGDYYKALRSGKAGVETGVIETVTANSIKLVSGKELHPDIIVTATGLKLRFAGGIKVTVDGTPYNVGEKFIWKGVMLEDLPNAAFVFGYVDASWTLGADATAQMVCRILKQMSAEGVVEVIPRRSAAEKRDMQEQPLLRLTSTYVRKAKGSLPKSGSGQWRPRSYYFQDMMMARYGDIKTSMSWIRGV